jgi:hypothetical protein
MLPKAARDMNIPTCRPASSMFPIATAGAGKREINPPQKNLDGMN